jgi:protocatechuate 3,4-dioxygenase beta subunit/5-hydroxyisourate hydrolase-like protein (transthyretin family)
MTMMSRTTLWSVTALVLAATASPAGEIRGRVLVDGRPRTGLSILVVPFESGLDRARREARGEGEPKPLAEGLTLEDGTFRVTLDPSVAPADEPVRIVVSGEKAVPRRLERLVDPAGEDLGDVRLGPATSLAGRVQDPRGGPVVGATVRLWASRGGQLGDDLASVEAVPQTATTGPDGTFRFDTAADAGNLLRVEAPGLATVERTVARAGALARPVTLALGHVLRGTVTLPDGRTPAGDAVVRYEGRTSTRWHEARPDGSFLIEGVPASEGGRVVAEAGERGRAEVPVAAGAREPVRVTLAPTAFLSGRVVDADTGRPIPGVRLVAKARDGGEFLARSGRDGRYSVPGLPPRPYRLEVDDERFVPWSSEVDVSPGESESRDVPLVRGAALSGRVVDERGTPIEGATIQVFRGGGRSAIRDFVRRMQVRSETVRTARDGSFKATRLEPGGGQRLDVRHEDYEDRSMGGIDLSPGATTSGISVVLRTGLALEGLVKDEEDRPLGGVEVELQQSRTFRGRRGGMSVTMLGPGSRPRKETGTDGRFAFRGLAAGDYTLIARRPGYARVTLDPVKLAEDGNLEPLELILAPGATISGFLRDGSGAGAPGWHVSARAAGEGGGPAFGPGGLRTEEPSGPDGAFLIEGLAEGEVYDLQVMGPKGLGPRLADVTAPADDVEITVEGGGRIHGRVVDAESGGPVSDFEVSYRPDARAGVRFFFAGGRGGRGPYQPQSFHAEDGAFVLEDVSPGRWTVEVSAEGFQPGSASGVVVEEGRSTEGIDIALSKGGTITGQVVESRSGQPILDATVRAELSGGTERRGMPRVLGRGENEAVTDADGRYEVTGLAPGTWTVTASHPEWSEATVSVELEDAPAIANLRLGLGATITGVVLAAGRPVAGAEVALGAAGEAGFRGFAGGESSLTGEDGRFRFERLSPGRYTLTALLRSQSSPPVEAAVSADGTQEVTLTLSEGAVIHGTIAGLPETQLGRVSVSAMGPDRYFASTRSGADGTFELTGVPEGSITLRASAGDFVTSTRTASTTVAIEAGQLDAYAEIVFEAGYRVEVRVSRSGQGVPDAFVNAFPEAGPGRGASGRTDEMGTCVLEGLQDGRYTVLASVQNGPPVRDTVELSGDTTVDLEIPAGRIFGTVVDAGTGQPLGDVGVRLEETGNSRFRFANMASSDSSGRFALEDVEPRTYQVTFQKPAYETETRQVNAAEEREVRVEMRRGEGLGLVARDGVFGTPLRGLMVRVVDRGGIAVFSGMVPLDSEGRGEVPSVKPGSYELRLSSSGYAPLVRPGVMVPSSALAFALTPGGTLEIRVGPDTLALPQPEARLYRPDGRVYLPSIFSTDGAIPLGSPVRRMEHVAPGHYVLAVEGGARQEVEVGEGAVSVVALP